MMGGIMNKNRRALAGIVLLFIIVCCAVGTAETYDFGGVTDNGEYSGTLAIDNNGNVAVTIASATGATANVQVGAQDSDDANGATAMQATTASGDMVFVGSGAANANGNTASTGALASGNAEIETVLGAVAGGTGVAAGQDTSMNGQTAIAGSLGVSGAGDVASTDTHLSDAGSIDTIQGAATGEVDFMGINAAGAAAGQSSTISASNGGWASSTATGRGSTAMTQASTAGAGNINTLQVAAAGEVDLTGLAEVSVNGAVAGQSSDIQSDNGGFIFGSAATESYEAMTRAEYTGNGNIDTIQVAAAGDIDGTLCSNSFDVGGAIAGQYSDIQSKKRGKILSGAASESYEAMTQARYSGGGSIQTFQVAAAGEVDLTGLAEVSVNGAVAGHSSDIQGNNGGNAITAAETESYEARTRAQLDGSGNIDTIQIAAAGEVDGTLCSNSIDVGGAVAGQSSFIHSERRNGGYANSAAETESYEARTRALLDGRGNIDTIQVAAAGEVDLTGLAEVSLDGAVAGQSVDVITSGGGDGNAISTAETENGYDYARVLTRFRNGGYIDDIIQVCAAGNGVITTPIDIEAEGAAAAQFIPSGSNRIISRAVHGIETARNSERTSPAFQYAVAGSFTDGVTIEGAAAGII